MANTRDAQRIRAAELMKSRKGSKRKYFFGRLDNVPGNMSE